MDMHIGIDLGGTKIEAVLMGAGGTIIARQRVATPQQDYQGTLKAIAALVSQLEHKLSQPASIGIGTPGSISHLTQCMKNCNSTCLNGQEFKQDIEQLLRREVRIANDADCFALSEAVDGAAAGFDSMFGVILGTGVGGGIVINGKLLSGPNSIAGEWGHNLLPSTAPRVRAGSLRRCYCGRDDCVETYLSGPGLARSFFELNAEYESAGLPFTAERVAGLAETGDQDALLVLDIYAQQLAAALAQVVNIVDPYAVVLGGGISNIESLYVLVPRYWATYIFTDQVQTRLLRNRHGDSSGVRGAAWLWI
jgi:predicted NBD/HSP70 family sugar kinase